MKFENGDDCGIHGSRTTKVFLKCVQNSNSTEIVEVSEPSTCKYEMVLQTPLACEYTPEYGHLTLNVYPYMNRILQIEWDSAKFELDNGIITENVSSFILKYFLN